MNTNTLMSIILYAIGAIVYAVQPYHEVMDTITKDIRKEFNDKGLNENLWSPFVLIICVIAIVLWCLWPICVADDIRRYIKRAFKKT